MKSLVLNGNYTYKVFVIVVVKDQIHPISLTWNSDFSQSLKKDSNPPNSLLLLRYL